MRNQVVGQRMVEEISENRVRIHNLSDSGLSWCKSMSFDAAVTALKDGVQI